LNILLVVEFQIGLMCQNLQLLLLLLLLCIIIAIMNTENARNTGRRRKPFTLFVLLFGFLLSTTLSCFGFTNEKAFASDCTSMSEEELVAEYGASYEISTPPESTAKLLLLMGIPRSEQRDYLSAMVIWGPVGALRAAEVAPSITDEERCDLVNYGTYLYQQRTVTRQEQDSDSNRETALDQCSNAIDLKILDFFDLGKAICNAVFSVQDGVTMLMQLTGYFAQYRMLVQDSTADTFIDTNRVSHSNGVTTINGRDVANMSVDEVEDALTVVRSAPPNLISSAWSQFLVFTNIAFAILFLIVIYSAATSTGLSNYSIKRILPRLILVAIAINVSYYICAAIVDLSNIVGNSILSLFDSIVNNALSNANFRPTTLAGSAFIPAIFGGVAFIGLNFSIIIILLFVLLIVLVLAVIGTFIMLAFRQVMLTILVIISPLAFVCLLLANTESWFKKWLKAFMELLMVFPILMGVTGACNFVSTIVLMTSGYGTTTTDINQLFSIFMSLILAVLPILLIWPITKRFSGLAGQLVGKVATGAVKVGKTAVAVGSMAATGGASGLAAKAAGGSFVMGAAKGIGGKIGGIASNIEKTAISGNGTFANSKTGKSIRDRYYRQQIGEQAGARRAHQEAIEANPDLAHSSDDYIASAYHGEADKVFKEQVAMEDAKAKASGQSQQEMEDIIKHHKRYGSSSTYSRAKIASAIGRWKPKGNEISNMVNNYGQNDKIINDLLAEKLATTDTGGMTSSSLLDDVKSGKYNINVSIRKKALSGEYDTEKYARTDPDMARLADDIILATQEGDVIGVNDDGSDKLAKQSDVDTILQNYESLIKTTKKSPHTRTQMTGDARKNAIYERYNSPTPNQPVPPGALTGSYNTDASNFNLQYVDNTGTTQYFSGQEMKNMVHRASNLQGPVSQQSLEEGMKKLLDRKIDKDNRNLAQLIKWQKHHPNDQQVKDVLKIAAKVVNERHS
jgi:type IV secretory pathway VirB6-like protein